MAVNSYGCLEQCSDCATPSACQFLREFDARRDEELRSTQMLGGVLLALLVVAVVGAVWALSTLF